MTAKIKMGDKWFTYVLVSDLDPDLWFTMNVDLQKIKERQQKSDTDTHIEKWWFLHTRIGDQELRRERI